MENKKKLIVVVFIVLIVVIGVFVGFNLINNSEEENKSNDKKEVEVVSGPNTMNHSIKHDLTTGKQACHVTISNPLDINLKNVKIVVSDKSGKVVGTLVETIDNHAAESRIYVVPLDSTNLNDDNVSIELQFNVTE